MRQNTTYRSRNFVLTALLSLALLPVRGLAGVDSYLRIDQLRPGQTHIGRANIQNIVDQNAEKTKKNNAKPENAEKQKTPLQTYAERIDGGDRLPVIKAPDGTFVMLDGHHRTTSYWSIYEDAAAQWDQGNHGPNEPRPAVPSIKVSIEENFSTRGWKNFAKWMIDHRKVYFDQETLKEARKRKGVPLDKPSDEEFIAKHAEFLCRNFLPKNFKALIDSPMRSVVGTVLYDLNGLWDAQQDKAGIKKADRKSLDGSNQAEYIEFYIGDRLKKKGVEASVVKALESQGIKPATLKGNEYNKSVLRVIEDAIFDDPQEREFLRNSCRLEAETKACKDEDKANVEIGADALYAIHNTKRATAAPQQPNAPQPNGQQPAAQPPGNLKPAEAAPGGP